MNEPAVTTANESDIEVLLNNMMSNAIKYNRDDGYVDINIKT